MLSLTHWLLHVVIDTLVIVYCHLHVGYYCLLLWTRWLLLFVVIDTLVISVLSLTRRLLFYVVINTLAINVCCHLHVGYYCMLSLTRWLLLLFVDMNTLVIIVCCH